jgi:hypothetical protein
MVRLKAHRIATALLTYYKDHDHHWPKTLAALTVQDQHGGPYLDADALTDPWGKRFQVDIAGPHHHGAVPDVYTIRPDATLIGNWGR